MKKNLTPQWLGAFAVTWLAAFLATAAYAAEAKSELKNLSINGGIDDGKARLIIEAFLGRLPEDHEKLIYATSLHHRIMAAAERFDHTFILNIDILQGHPTELALTIAGEGEIRDVSGDALQDWSVRQGTNGVRVLVLRPAKGPQAQRAFQIKVTGEQRVRSVAESTPALTLTPEQPALLNGYVRIEPAEGMRAQVGQTSALAPVEIKFLPEPLRVESRPEESEPLAYRFQGSAYALTLQVAPADPETLRVVLRDVELIGQLSDQMAAFTLKATAHVRNPSGGTLRLLSGKVALTEAAEGTDWRIRLRDGQFILQFDRAGVFPVALKFNAAVSQNDTWKTMHFRVAPGALQALRLRGLASETRFQFGGAARPEHAGGEFVSYVPPDGQVQLSWQQAAPEAEGKLFYAAEMLSQITVSPGLMSQSVVLELKVMQGELSAVSLLLRGQGEVTRVLGEQVLAWKVEPVPNSPDRRLTAQFNQAQKDRLMLQVQMQTPLNAFPQTAEAMQLRPEEATRFSGFYRIVNEGAVRLEIPQASGLSQIAPEQFPENDVTRSFFRPGGGQRFVYRFSGAEMALRIQADQILPELAVSEVLTYHLGENELAIDVEIELDIREAPLRELLLRVPKGFALARLTAPGLNDYFLREPTDQAEAEARLLYAPPATGRQVIQARLERNQALPGGTWELPRIEVLRAKSVRGHVGISADAGFRLTPERTQSLLEIATAFFPRKAPGLQTAFRITEPSWQATVRVERQPQSLQADALHLFSIGEGVAYGSSVINYVISGAPVSTFRFELSQEYFNVEFTGKDVRNWQKTTNGYVVQLHTAVLGPYTVLATYERPFKAQGETLGFTGARPLEVQSEQGHTLVISAYQFKVQAVEVSAGLLALEAGEVPAEYRLLFDAPVLAAYRYTSRPFNLRLALSPLAQGDSLSQVVDRALLTTRISKAGQVLTDAQYFVKSRGHPYFPLALPEGVQLWSATVNGAAVVPVTNTKENLIPLPQRTDPNALLQIDVKLAARSSRAARVRVAAPSTAAPVLLAEWKVSPDTGQRLVFRKGSLRPMRGAVDASGFGALARIFSGGDRAAALISTGAALALLALSVLVWRWTIRDGVYRASGRWLTGLALGGLAFLLAVAAILNLAELTWQHRAAPERELTFLAPVQQASSALTIEVANLEDKASARLALGYAWPALLGVALWLFGAITAPSWFRSGGWILGWLCIAWSALRWPNGAAVFLAILILFLLLHVCLPALRRLGQLPVRPKPETPDVTQHSPAPAVPLILIAGLSLSFTQLADAQTAKGMAEGSAQLPASEGGSRRSAAARVESWPESPVANLVNQEIIAEDQGARAVLQVRWPAEKGRLLPLLFDPAVLTDVQIPTNALKLVQSASGGKRGQFLLALESGRFDVQARYQTRITERDGESGFIVPTPSGLINRVQITIVNADVEVRCPTAVSLEREMAQSNTVVRLVLAPSSETAIRWKPRTRDVRQEKAVFYAEASQLYVPTAGLIEGVHHVQIRPAHGELRELSFDVPAGATITDVGPPVKVEGAGEPSKIQAASPPFVSVWRFDPDSRKLRVHLQTPQSRPFALVIRSQVPTGTLPSEQSVGLLALAGASGQIGLLGVATGNEVQVDQVTSEGTSPINIEDFPAAVLQPLQEQFPGLALRRAFRYLETNATARWTASAVEADVRVEAQHTLSLGEDRTVLAVNASVTIARAGIFRLSFTLPATLEVESITGDSLTHWTDSKSAVDRIITLHLRGKTEGQQQFAITLSGPGLKSAQGWVAPKVAFREASKQQGTLLIVPEQGMRLQVANRESLTQLDPQKSGIRQKGVLAFRLLQAAWSLALDIEQVEPWIQVTGLQHAIVNEALIKVAANLQYQIENTGLKAFRILLPANADTVRFQGDQVADFRAVSGVATNGLQLWEIKLHRRMIGPYFLQVSYQTPIPEQTSEITLRGIETAEVNLQRGFVTIQSGGRLQVRVDALPAALQSVEWQSIPKALQKDQQTASANEAFRLVEPSFALPLKIERHAAAKLLPGRVNNITLTSVVSDDGVMLTQVRLELLPGDKRLLHLTLPPGARFWFAFVNQSGVWPWREGDRVLIPLEQQSRSGQPTPVEFFFSSQVGAERWRGLDLELFAPKFDLPLENITWRVFLDEKWQVRRWTGSLQLEEQQLAGRGEVLDAHSYLQKEMSAQREKSREAQQMLALGNSALEQGDPQQARRAFQAAFGLSQGDDAFNEDARVQLNNVKLQQALVGLNVRQGTATGDSLAGRLRELRATNSFMNYTQQDAKTLLDRNSIDDNAAFTRLAQRLIQQQEAAIPSPAAIRANIPEQGRVLTFKRAVLVDTWADLGVKLSAVRSQTANWRFRALVLLVTFFALAGLTWTVRVRPVSTAGRF